MPATATKLENKLADLRRLYIDGIEIKLAEIGQGWLAMSEAVDETQRETNIRKVHSFAGSGAMYGFLAISEAARHLESKLVEIQESGGLPSMEQRADGQARLESLGQAIREGILEVESTKA